MKKSIPAPIKDSLTFRAEPQANKQSSTAAGKDWVYAPRNVKISATGVPGRIDSNHPRNPDSEASFHCEVAEDLS